MYRVSGNGYTRLAETSAFQWARPLFTRYQAEFPFNVFCKTGWNITIFAMVSYDICVKILIVIVTYNYHTVKKEVSSGHQTAWCPRKKCHADTPKLTSVSYTSMKVELLSVHSTPCVQLQHTKLWVSMQ